MSDIWERNKQIEENYILSEMDGKIVYLKRSNCESFASEIFSEELYTDIETSNKLTSFNRVFSSGDESSANEFQLQLFDSSLAKILSKPDNYKKDTDTSFLDNLDNKMNGVFNYDNRSLFEKIGDFFLGSGPATNYIKDSLAKAQELYNKYCEYLIDLKAFSEYQLLYQSVVEAYNSCYKKYVEVYKRCADLKARKNINEAKKHNGYIVEEDPGINSELAKLENEINRLKDRMRMYSEIIKKIEQIINYIIADMKKVNSEMEQKSSEFIEYTELDMSEEDLDKLEEFGNFLNGQCECLTVIADNINTAYSSKTSIWDLGGTNPGTMLSDYVQNIEKLSKNYKTTIENIEKIAVDDFSGIDEELASLLINNKGITSGLIKEYVGDLVKSKQVSALTDEQINANINEIITDDMIRKSEEETIKTIKDKCSVSEERANQMYKEYVSLDVDKFIEKKQINALSDEAIKSNIDEIVTNDVLANKFLIARNLPKSENDIINSISDEFSVSKEKASEIYDIYKEELLNKNNN